MLKGSFGDVKRLSALEELMGTLVKVAQQQPSEGPKLIVAAQLEN